MPTRYTQTIGKLIYLNALRKNYLQKFAFEGSVSWEYVPVLEHIRRFPGCMQTDISRKLKVTAAAVTQSTQKLEKAGLIEKKKDKSNLRVKHLYITEKGEKMLGAGSKIFDMVDEIMFRGFSEEDVQRLEELLNRVNKNMSEFQNGIDERHLPWEF